MNPGKEVLHPSRRCPPKPVLCPIPVPSAAVTPRPSPLPCPAPFPGDKLIPASAPLFSHVARAIPSARSSLRQTLVWLTSFPSQLSVRGVPPTPQFKAPPSPLAHPQLPDLLSSRYWSSSEPLVFMCPRVRCPRSPLEHQLHEAGDFLLLCWLLSLQPPP